MPVMAGSMLFKHRTQSYNPTKHMVNQREWSILQTRMLCFVTQFMAPLISTLELSKGGDGCKHMESLSLMVPTACA